MNTITVETIVQVSIEKAWDLWTKPLHIEHWNQASTDWECPHAKNDLSVGGKFVFTMSAKDKSVSFDFNGVYTEIILLSKIAYIIEGGRKVEVVFEKISDNQTKVIELFEPENENPLEMQRGGWQAILNSFKNYAEGIK